MFRKKNKKGNNSNKDREKVKSEVRELNKWFRITQHSSLKCELNTLYFIYLINPLMAVNRNISAAKLIFAGPRGDKSAFY